MIDGCSEKGPSSQEHRRLGHGGGGSDWASLFPSITSLLPSNPFLPFPPYLCHLCANTVSKMVKRWRRRHATHDGIWLCDYAGMQTCRHIDIGTKTGTQAHRHRDTHWHNCKLTKAAKKRTVSRPSMRKSIHRASIPTEEKTPRRRAGEQDPPPGRAPHSGSPKPAPMSKTDAAYAAAVRLGLLQPRSIRRKRSAPTSSRGVLPEEKGMTSDNDITRATAASSCPRAVVPMHGFARGSTLKEGAPPWLAHTAQTDLWPDSCCTACPPGHHSTPMPCTARVTIPRRSHGGGRSSGTPRPGGRRRPGRAGRSSRAGRGRSKRTRRAASSSGATSAPPSHPAACPPHKIDLSKTAAHDAAFGTEQLGQ